MRKPIDWDWVGSAIGGASTLLLIGGAYLGLPAYFIYQNHQTCTTEVVAFDTVYSENSSLPKGQEKEVFAGANGENKVCKKRDGSVASTATLISPQNRIIEQGTYVESPKPTYFYSSPTYSYRIGAICMDGSRSSATGRGACSWHGGVSEWLYSD